MRPVGDSLRGIIVKRRALRRTEQADERVLEHRLARLRDQLVRRAHREHPAVTQDDDRIAERGDLLHHVRAEQQALAARAEIAEQRTQRARAHDVEAVRGLVEQDRLRIVDERPRDGDLHPLALRESLRARSAIAAMPSARTSSSILVSSASAASPCSAP
jgi:hypothetical protein